MKTLLWIVVLFALTATTQGASVTVAAQRVLDVDAGRMLGDQVLTIEAIRSATVVNAELLRMQGEIGTLRPGAYADLVAVVGDPLADVSLLERPVWIMKSGAVVR